ncbi:MAG: RNA polymerase sigma factor [Oscillospiraceae bacterium]
MDGGAEAYKRFLSGDDHGLEQVIELYKDSLIFFLMQYVRSADIAEELTEDTFVTLAVKKPKFTENARFRTWLYTIARNKALNYLRSAAFRKCVPLEQAELTQELDCPEKNLLRQERYRALYSAIESLSVNQREMVYLVYFEEMNIAQAASIIHKTQRQGSNILFRARQKLKSILQEEGFQYENKS